MNNSQVAHVWAHGKPGKGSNLKSDGITLTSYYTTIAARIDDIIYISADNMSRSTGRHLSYARQAVGYADDIFRTHAFTWSGSNPALTHEAMILPEARYIIQALDVVLSSNRRSTTKLDAIETYNYKKNQIIELAARVGVSLPEMPEVHNTEEAVKEYQEKARQAAEKREAARVAAQKKQQEDDKEQFNPWLQGIPVLFPYSFQKFDGTDYIKVSIGGDKVVTSQGAECPLDHAVKALRFWESRKIKKLNDDGPDTRSDKHFESYKTNGHKIPLGVFTLDSIDEAGTVKAGCHTFSRQEIERFINQWREVLGL